MRAREPGTRVFAAHSMVEGCARLFGFGTYVGDEVPPPGIRLMGVDLHDCRRPNPKIVLDDGRVVWGCECWWGPEGALPKGATVEPVDIRAERVKAYGYDPMEGPSA